MQMLNLYAWWLCGIYITKLEHAYNITRSLNDKTLVQNLFTSSLLNVRKLLCRLNDALRIKKTLCKFVILSLFNKDQSLLKAY